MNPRLLIAAVTGLSLLISGSISSAESNHRLGVGINYWKTLKDIDVHDFDKNGVSWLASYQYAPAALLKIEADMEIFGKGFAASEKNVYAPQAFLILGSGIYAGVGAGIYYSDGKFADNPFYAFRAGLNLELLPSIFLDINANYRFENWKNMNDMVADIKTDTVTLGAALRLAF